MLFDLRPKENPSDLFGRDRELEELRRLINTEWIAVVGARMTGKTSLVKTFLNESSRKGKTTFYVNLMGASGLTEFLERLARAAGEKVVTREVSIKLPLLGIGKASRFVEDFFHMLRDGEVIVGLDEVQEMYRSTGQFLKILKLIHDSYPNVRFIFTGSMFGLMHTLLQPKVSSPMYGRKPARVELLPFPREESVRFLRAGFEEVGMRSEEGEIEEAVDMLNGYVGWLTYYGNLRCVRGMGREASLRGVVEEGKKVVKEELENFLKGRDRQAYLTVLKAASLGARWAEIRRSLGAGFNSKRLSDILRTLTASMLVEKRDRTYVVSDPILRRALLS